MNPSRVTFFTGHEEEEVVSMYNYTLDACDLGALEKPGRRRKLGRRLVIAKWVAVSVED